MRKGVLFDVDGTLIKVAGAGREAICRAMAQVFGLALAPTRDLVLPVDFRGRTDALLLEEIARVLGQQLDGALPRVVAAYLEALDGLLNEASGSAGLQLLGGVAELLLALEARQIPVGLLTGNIRAAARVKLRPFGLAHLVDRAGGFGDDGRSRPEIAALAVQRLGALGVDPANVVVVGDTEHDVTAAHAAGARAVAVASGWTSAAELAVARPDLQLDSLVDTTRFLTWLETL